MKGWALFKIRFGQNTAPPEDWRVGDVIVRLTDPEDSVRVQAWRRGVFAVHELVGGKFNLTHAPTGARIGVFLTGEIAAQFADEVRGMFNWKTLPVGDRDAERKILPIMQKYKSQGMMVDV